jgi:hypothetical protein
MSIWANIVLAGVIWLTGFGIGIKWQHGVQAVQVAESVRRAIAQTDQRRVDIHAAATKYEAIKTAAEVREIRVKEEVDRVVEKPVYTNICLDDDGLRILADDIASRHTGGRPKPAVPSPADSDPDNWGGRAAVGSGSGAPL